MPMLLIYLIKATLVLGAALLGYSWLIRRNPRWRILLCELSAGLVLVLPLAPLLPISITLPWLPSPSVSGFPDSTNSLTLGSTLSRIIPDDPSQDLIADTSASMEEFAVTEGALVESRILSMTTVPWSIYILGLLWLGYRRVRSHYQLASVLDEFVAPDPEIRAEFEKISHEMGLTKAPRLIIVPLDISPFCMGVRDRAVVLPKAITRRVDYRTMVLRHELSHVARHDVLRTTFMGIATALLWFHPLIWLIRRGHTSSIEELSDRVASGNADGRGKYRTMLADQALSLRHARQKVPFALGIFGTPQIIVRLRRLEAMRTYTPLHRGWLALGVLGAVLPLFLLVAFTDLSHGQSTTHTQRPLSWIPDLTEEQSLQADLLVKNSLARLVAWQAPDGSFPRESKKREGMHEAGVTGLAGMAFFSHGGQLGNSPYHEPMTRCARYILRCQSDDGWFHESPGGNRNPLYHHAISIWFLANAKDALPENMAIEIAAALPKGLSNLIKAQAVPKVASAQGGWRYTAESKDSDISCTLWAMKALIAALDHDNSQECYRALDAATAYVAGLQANDGGFSYVAGFRSMPSTSSRTAMGLYCLQAAGKGDSESAKRAIKLILTKRFEINEPYEFYGTYMAAEAVWLREGDDAQQFATWMLDHLSFRQEDDGVWPSKLGDVMGTVSVALAFSPPRFVQWHPPVEE
ncbi:MAG: hypothetical protein KDN22_13820 [Verrucomicrobiae bacterium]|nr:hypothetical protein [Verrucomicrobiae bacterium]